MRLLLYGIVRRTRLVAPHCMPILGKQWSVGAPELSRIC